MENIKDVFADILKPKSSFLSKSIGVAIATLTYFCAGMVMLPVPCCRKNASARQHGVVVLNSLVLSAAYAYSWTQGNPHTAEALENSPTNEIPLMLTAGYYILDSLSFRSIMDIIHHVFSIFAIFELLLEGRAANVGVTYAFLVEVANLMYYIRKAAIHLQSPCVIFLNILYPAVFIIVRVIVLLYFTYNIINNKDIPEFQHTLASVLFMLSFFYCFRMFQNVFSGSEESQTTRRSRSRTPRSRRSSKNRPKSRRSRCKLTSDLCGLFQ